MIYNKFDPSNQVLTPDGYSTLQFLRQEGSKFKAYTLEQGFVPMYFQDTMLDAPTRIVTAKLDNGFTNITTEQTDYLTAHDLPISASGILNKPLKSLHYYNRACNDFVYAGFISAFCDYSRTQRDYYIQPAISPYYREDLFSLLWSCAWDRCRDFIYLHDPYYRDTVLKVFDSYTSTKAPMLPRRMNEFSLYEQSCVLRGMMSVYLNMEDKKRFSFVFTSEHLARQVAELLTTFEIGNEVKVERTPANYDPLNKGRLYELRPTLIIEPGFIDRFMSTIGVMTDCAISHVEKVARKTSTKATEVTSVRNTAGLTELRLYGIKPVDFDPGTSYHIIMGGVYVKCYK